MRTILVAVVLLGAAVVISLTAPLGADYPGPPCRTCDFAAPPIEALVHGHVGTFFHTQPVMGSFSLLVRAPFAALSYIGHHSLRWEYRLGTLICLLFVALLAWWLTRIMQAAGRGLFAQLIVVGLLIAGPMVFKSLYWGHPEEPLAGALCVAAVLLAADRRSLAAGAVLGLAVATKPWALLAAVPVLLVATDRRAVLALTGAGVAALLTLPMLIADPTRFWAIAHAYGIHSTSATPANIWWPYAHQAGITITPHGSTAAYAVPNWVGSVAHPLVLVITALLGALYWWSRRNAISCEQTVVVDMHRASGALQLLALIFLLRCLLDPLTYSYHHEPFMLALVAAGALSARRLPYAAMISAAALWILNDVIAPSSTSDVLHNAYLLWAVPTVAYLAIAVYSRASVSRPSRRSSGLHAPAAA